MKLYTRSDRTSCHRWEANQFRLFLHMGAYWLLHELRGAHLTRMGCAARRVRERRKVFLN
jgi:hypothetical protein